MPAYHHPFAYKTACSTFQDAKPSKIFMICANPLPGLPLVGCDLPDNIFMPELLGTFWQLSCLLMSELECALLYVNHIWAVYCC